MEKVRRKAIAALEKQVELLGKDGVSPGEIQLAIDAIVALSGLIIALDS